MAGIASAQETRQATGVKVGEVTDTSAIVWMRVTAKKERNKEGTIRKGKVGDPLPDNVKVDELEGACPGAAGQVRLRWGIKGRPERREKHRLGQGRRGERLHPSVPADGPEAGDGLSLLRRDRRA